MEPPAALPTQTAAAPDKKPAAWLYWLFSILLALWFVFVFLQLWTVPNVSEAPGWPDAMLLVLAAAGTAVALARQLPWQNVLGAMVIIGLLGGGAHALGEVTDLPFGPFKFMPNAGPQLFKTLPWALPFLWVVVILNSRGVARLILRPWRKLKTYGYWLIGLTAVLATLFDLALDPFATRVEHYWFWLPTRLPVTWFGAPLVNFLSWAVVSLLILGLATPVLINKQARRKSSPDYQPLAVWLGALLLCAGATAAKGLWLATGVDAAVMVVTAIFAIRGAWW